MKTTCSRHHGNHSRQKNCPECRAIHEAQIIAADPEAERRRLAVLAAQRALKAGLIKRQPCEVCGGAWAEMHHTDYAKPLVVTFLCRFHHLIAHRVKTKRTKKYVDSAATGR